MPAHHLMITLGLQTLVGRLRTTLNRLAPSVCTLIKRQLSRKTNSRYRPKAADQGNDPNSIGKASSYPVGYTVFDEQIDIITASPRQIGNIQKPMDASVAKWKAA